ncbi:MAG: hypothetical protein KBT28_04640 [Bacteroidales bacterium]|nr:hypothetical protein [Candidatus Colimorpha merdihippi]
MQKNEIKQGQTLGVTIALSEPADGEIALGIYGQTANEKILLRSEDGTLAQLDSTHYVAIITAERTRQMRAGAYTCEMLYKAEGGEFVSISDKVQLNVMASRIGKETEL